jgi:hypothetical protein
MVAKWDFNDSGNATTSVDAVAGYTGTFSGTGGRTASGQGRTGTTGDFAFAPGSASGAMIANSSGFLSALNPTMLDQKLSITYWQYLTTVSYAPPNPTSFFAVSTTASTNRGLSAHSPYLNGDAFFDTSGQTPGNSRINGPLGATNNTWQLITMIYDSGSRSIYRNGTHIVSSVVGSPGLALKNDITAFYVGNANTGTEGFKGYMDDFTIWKGALTLSEINNIVIPESSTTAMIAILALGASIHRKRRRSIIA